MNHSSVLITNRENDTFGTGFVVHEDKNNSYILTCAHVVEATPKTLLIDHISSVEILYIGASDGLDLAILIAPIINKKPLVLMQSKCRSFDIQGFKKFNSNFILKPIQCTLDTETEIILKNGEYISSCQINFDKNNMLEKGYSGSPLISKNTGNVFGVASDKSGKNGYAILIENLKTIWKDMPITLLWEEENRLCITFRSNKDFKIFISYAYSNREQEQWIFEFLQSIGNILENRFGKDNFFSIAYEKNSNMQEEILDVDVFLVLLSKDYINNKSYLEELQTFKSKSNVSNTIIIEYEKIEKPKEIEHMKSFKSWSETENYNNFDLIEDIAKKIRICIEDKGKDTKKSIKEKIFLATTTDDLDSFRNDIRRYLEDLDYDVYPKQYYPHDDGNDFKEAVKKDLKNCKIFIQLLSQFSKKGTDSLPEGYNKAQFDLAKELKVPILQWSERINLDCVEDKIQRTLLSTEFIKIIPIEEFKRTIERELEKIKDKKKVKKKSIYNSFAFIDSCYREVKDRIIAENIHNKLSKYLMVSGPPTIKKPSEISRDIDEKLLLCDYYILVYGSVHVKWIEDQILIRYMKISLRRDKKISSIIIYDSPAGEKEDINISAPYIKIINGRKSDRIDEIKNHIDFLEEGDSDEIYT